VDGKLLKAATDLETVVKGTAAAPKVSSWGQQMRARVLAEQTAALLQAHASAKLPLWLEHMRVLPRSPREDAQGRVWGWWLGACHWPRGC
jgi:hypothetical protein